MPEVDPVYSVEDFFDSIAKYLSPEQVAFVRNAYELAAEAHMKQRRASGEPYIIHPLGVAMILAKLQLDELTLAAAFLHDVIEDTDITYDELYAKFGPDIADGVEALTKNKTFQSKQEQMRDSIERLLTQPYEVQMVKLADRITNLGTPPKHWDNEKIKSYHKEASFILSCLRNSNIYLAKRLEEKIAEYTKYIKE